MLNSEREREELRRRIDQASRERLKRTARIDDQLERESGQREGAGARKKSAARS